MQRHAQSGAQLPRWPRRLNPCPAAQPRPAPQGDESAIVLARAESALSEAERALRSAAAEGNDAALHADRLAWLQLLLRQVRNLGRNSR